MYRHIIIIKSGFIRIHFIFKAISYYSMYTFLGAGGQPVYFWQNDFLKLVIFKKQQTWEELQKLSKNYPFVRDLLLQGKCPFANVSSSMQQEEKDDSISRNSFYLFFLETLPKEKARLKSV